ncbi:protein RFT1 homolog [Chelonus insularis]|uniref:protein RFT1 homolog n=1 Tax=Chelonus insularis TaxID=460826 RepID=UPI0015882F69|nr:protein RFT1 homolog [Chelonus insularis]
MAKNLLTSTSRNISFDIIFQITCRCITFFINAFVARHVDRAVLGVINVRLLLLESMILFLSREPFFRACLNNSSSRNWAQIINQLWLTVPLSTFMSIFFGYIWLSVLTTSETLPPYYTFAVFSIAISCVVYLTSLAAQVVASTYFPLRFQIIVDFGIILFRTLVFIAFYEPESALLAFGIAQLVSMTLSAIIYYICIHFYIKRLTTRNSSNNDFPFKSIKEFIPGQLKNEASWIDKNLMTLTRGLFEQSILMQILTEGEKMIMTIFPVMSFAEQGTYDVVNNLGSLAARFIFRPIEDQGYIYFTKLVKRDKPISQQDPELIQESIRLFSNLCSAVSSIGLIVLIFGQSYSSTLLWLYGGSKFTTEFSITLLRAHCLAVLLLAINGITECYANATADVNTIKKSNLIRIYQSIAFLLVSYGFAKWLGPVGFIFGNCVNMALRIFYSISFINARHDGTGYQPLHGLLPKPLFSVSLIISGFVTIISHMYYFPEHKLAHFFIGVLMFGMVTLSWAYENREIIEASFKKWQKKKSQ